MQSPLTLPKETWMHAHYIKSIRLEHILFWHETKHPIINILHHNKQHYLPLKNHGLIVQQKEQDLEWETQKNCHIIHWNHEHYPELLSDLFTHMIMCFRIDLI